MADRCVLSIRKMQVEQHTTGENGNEAEHSRLGSYVDEFLYERKSIWS